MEQSPSWESNRSSASQEIPHILWNSKVHYRFHNSPPFVSILNQINPIRVVTSDFLEIIFNIILPSTPGSSKWSLSLRFPYQNPVYASSLPPYALHALPISFYIYILRSIYVCVWGCVTVPLYNIQYNHCLHTRPLVHMKLVCTPNTASRHGSLILLAARRKKWVNYYERFKIRRRSLRSSWGPRAWVADPLFIPRAVKLTGFFSDLHTALWV